MGSAESGGVLSERGNGSIGRGTRGTPARGTPARGTPARGTPARGTPARGTPREGSWHHAVESGAHRVYRPGGRPGSQPPKKRSLVGDVARGAAFASLAGLSALGVVQGAAWLSRTDALPVRSVAVRGVADARAAEVVAYAAVKDGTPLLALDTAAVAARVAEHPWVKDVAVRVVPPDGVEIIVAERAPKALLAVGDLYLVDDTGAPFKAARPGDGLDLPIIAGLDADRVAAAGAAGTDDVRAAVALLAEHERQGRPGGTVSEVVVVDGVGFDVVFTSGLRARIGRDDFPGKLGRLATVLQKLATEKLQASFVHLDDARRPERVAVRLRGGAERLSSSGT